MYQLFCDSNCELWYTTVAELGLNVIRMPYTIGGREYFYDMGEHTDFKAFLDQMRAGEVPKTSAINEYSYMEYFEPVLARGEDIYYVTFSHKMSATFNAMDAAIAKLKEKYPERKCTVFDTKGISLGAGIQMEYAAELKNRGATDEEIVDALKDFTDRVAVYFVVDDLMHLKRGGRLSGFAAFAGTMLQLKPILTFDKKGSLTVLQKVSGKKQALKVIADKVIKDLTGTAYNVYVVDADVPKEGDMVADMIKEKRPDAKVVRQTVGPVIGAHCGPGTIGVIFIADKRPIPLEKEENE